MRKPKPTGKTWTRPGLAAGPGLEFWGRLRQEGLGLGIGIGKIEAGGAGCRGVSWPNSVTARVTGPQTRITESGTQTKVSSTKEITLTSKVIITLNVQEFQFYCRMKKFH